MNKANSYSLRTNPFHTYRDPETGYWITVVPQTTLIEKMTPTIAARQLRLVAAEEFGQLKMPAS